MKKILTFFVIALLFTEVKAQGTATIDKLFLQVTPAIGSPTETEQKFFARAVLYFSNTNSITNVKIKLGTTEGGNDLLEQDFAFAASTTTIISDNKAYIKLGKFTHQGTYYLEVKLEYSGGSVSTVFSTTN